MLRHGNSFTIEGDKLHISHAYLTDEYVTHILNIDDTGQRLYEDYVEERINGDISP